MRELLLGYLLGALEPHEIDLIEQRLANDPQLQQELHELAEKLLPLSDADGEFDPPEGLADRTCDLVASYQNIPEPAATPAAPARSAPASLLSHREPITPSRSLWRWADIVVTAAVVAGAALLFFPSIAASWYESRKLACQHNLVEVGRGLTEYSDLHQGYFPDISEHGEVTTAGFYGPLLLERNLLNDPRFLVCPADESQRQTAWQPPTLTDLEHAAGPIRAQLQRECGGSYGYSLGHVSDGRYQPTKNCGRTHFAILADSPSSHLPRRQSANHGGRGQNVLYEDMHVDFVTCCRDATCGDDFFTNRHGVIAAGADASDAVIGASDSTPFIKTVSSRK